MKMKITSLALLALLVLLTACAEEPESEAVACADDCEIVHVSEQDDHVAEGEEDEHAGHDHGAEGSDLDRSAAELFAANCEHDMHAFECESCSYEVGVVRLPKGLLDSGLAKLTEAKPVDLDALARFTGEISFDEGLIAHLGTRVAGVVEKVHAKLGDEVAEGERLVTFLSGELAEAEADFLMTQAELAVAEAALLRQRELREAEISSEREWLEAQQDEASKRILADLAGQKLLRFGMGKGEIAELESGRRGADGLLELRAPFAGRVLDLHAVLGEQWEAGEEIILFGDTSRLWVWVDVYESQLAAVSSAVDGYGLPVSLSVHSHPEKSFAGRIDYLDGRMDEHTRTVKARVILDNRAGHLRPGMFAEVEAVLSGGAGRLALPEAAVMEDEGRSFVFVHQHDDYYLRRPVNTGRRGAGNVEILDGLEPGQLIVAEGAFLLKSDVLRSKMGEGCAH
ncbi:efflux RND transporter periplasmic adaptor subunit [bacterium]|nr:efflux RND transporter periplasmic adaptor subunit [bacterium]